MIRIDLGKDADQRKQKKKSGAPSAFKLPEGLKFERSDLGGVLLLMGACAFSILPYLFVEQFKVRAEEDFKKEKAVLTDSKNQLQQEISKYESYKTELENFDKQRELLAKRIAAVNDVLNSRSGPVSVIDALGQSLPAGAWLNRIELGTRPNPYLNFGGTAYTHEDVTDFAERLAASIYIQSVELKEVIGAKSSNGDDVKNFSFEAIPKGFKGLALGDRDTANKQK
ncbi:hypothetical protein EBQ90_01750 [bacterium]|nr:hypothetical protein [bacterium]